MRKSQSLAGQQINHAGKRRNRQKLGQNRRIVDVKVTDFSMPDEAFIGSPFGINTQRSAAHIVI